MKFAVKWTLGFLALALVTAALAADPADSPQIIKLSDGHEYRFAGASGGTNHLLPGLHGAIPTPEGLFIWLEPTGSNANVPFKAGRMIELHGTLADEKGLAVNTPCIAVGYTNANGTWYYNNLSGPPGSIFLWFPVVPRRSATLECKMDEYARDAGGLAGTLVRADVGRLKFRNPFFGNYPQWQAEAVPAVKSMGEDIDVRLNRFDKVLPPAGHAGFPVDGATMARLSTARLPFTETLYHFSVSFLSSQVKNETWTVSGVDVSDATGNRTGYDVQNPAGPEGYGVYGPLAPGEAALKLMLTLKRTSGILASDLITFTNLPVLHLGGEGGYAPANGTSLTNHLDGIPIVVRNILTDDWHKFHGAWPGSCVVELDIPTHPSGITGDIMEVVTDAGEVLTAMPDSVGPHPRTGIEYHQVLPQAKFLNVTVAVQKTRTVEFLVKP